MDEGDDPSRWPATDAPVAARGGSVTPNPWQGLRDLTDARIALGRAGVSLPTRPQLAFQLAHAQARDAVHLALDAGALVDALAGLGYEALRLHSAAADRHVYLQRPDLGRRLDEASRATLLAWRDGQAGGAVEGIHDAAGLPAEHRPFDVAFIVADGLSPLAIGRHALPFLQGLLPRLRDEGWRIAPLGVVEQGRVALADEVGELLGARLSVILIGERPGLSSPDSMGLYLTWMPRVGLTDARRNCISNIRQAGLSYEDAARRLHGLLTRARDRRMSGVQLKEG